MGGHGMVLPSGWVQESNPQSASLDRSILWKYLGV